MGGGVSEMNGSSEVTSPTQQDPERSGAWPRASGPLGPQSRLALACLSENGLNIVLGSWLTVDCGWDRTSVCCYGCRTLEGDGWIIMANATE